MVLVSEPFVAPPLLVCEPTAVVPAPLKPEAFETPVALAGETATDAQGVEVDTAVTSVQPTAQEVWRFA